MFFSRSARRLLLSLTLVAAVIAVPTLTAQRGAQPSQPPAAPTAAQLLQSGINKQTVDGKLEEAIAIYQRIVSGYPSERAIVATALVRMAQCHEQLGNRNAQALYERVLREFGDQRDAAALAKARLATMGTATSAANREPVARLLWARQNNTLPTPAPDGGAVPSPDGRFLVFTGNTVDPANRQSSMFDLYLYEAATGTTRRLTKGVGCTAGSTECGMSGYSTAWSPDGSKIAFVWSEGPKWVLHVINVDGSGHRLLKDNVLRVCDWSPDGKEVLTLGPVARQGDGSLVAITVADGSARTVVPPTYRLGLAARFSPDGRYVAYTKSKPTDDKDSDIYAVSSDGGADWPVLDDVANADLVGWTPDGRALIFFSDRGPSLGLWSLPIAGGKAAGAPHLVKGDIGLAESSNATATRDGSVYYSTTGPTADVYLANLDPTGTTLDAPLTNASTTSEGFTAAPAWSADGTILGFLSGFAASGIEASALDTLDVRTGKLHRVTLSEPASLFGSAWAFAGAPSEAALFLAQIRGNDGPAFGWIDVRTGEVVRRASKFFASGISPDGTRAYMATRDQAARTGSLTVMDFVSLDSRETCRSGELFRVSTKVAVSPDGKSVAYFLRTEDQTRVRAIRVMQVATCESREIHITEEPTSMTALAWSADGRRIFFGTQDLSGDGGGQFWSIPAHGGRATPSGVNMGRIYHIAVHPDGRRLALDIRGNEPYQLWVLERFLPPAKKAPVKGGTVIQK